MLTEKKVNERRKREEFTDCFLKIGTDLPSFSSKEEVYIDFSKQYLEL